MKEKNQIPVLFSKVDIARRWGMSKQGVNNLSIRHDDFPVPVMFIHSGKTPLYTLDSLIVYENKRKRQVVSQGAEEVEKKTQ